MDSISHNLKIIDEINPKWKKKIGLNQKELSQILGCSASTLEARRKDGTGCEYISMGKRIIYPKLKVAEFLTETIKTA